MQNAYLFSAYFIKNLNILFNGISSFKQYGLFDLGKMGFQFMKRIINACANKLEHFQESRFSVFLNN
ncbi:hypothetical protein T4A_6359 [Trichinella pseudospiralis]|uniref:Uncharacterized protein n=1 Tax=Trichinella pseudospiralis TaxID=6337 RepID=A0A0V1EFU3_TRIPS|nr:hypothetical protein T4A_6359 [Trichinella pseudospiralis]